MSLFHGGGFNLLHAEKESYFPTTFQVVFNDNLIAQRLPISQLPRKSIQLLDPGKSERWCRVKGGLTNDLKAFDTETFNQGR